MPPALWTLLWLNARATGRRMGRQARTRRGAVFAVFGVLVVVGYLLPTVLVNRRVPQADPAIVRSAAPLAVLLFCVLNLLASAGERAVSFSPAEVDFLFPGPFTRRQLLAYKLVKTGLGSVMSALVFGLVLARYGGTFPCRAVGVWFTFQFFQLVAMVTALVQTTVGERLFTTGRRGVLLAILAVLVAAVAPGAWAQRSARPDRLAAHVNDTRVGRAVLAPFGVFARATLATRFFPTGLGWAAAAAGIDAALVAVVVGLDANYLEAAATASAKRYDRVARIRRAGLAGMASPASARLRVPMLPWLGGVGPVAWRQLTGVVRTARGLLMVLAVLAVVAGGTIAHADASRSSIFTLVGVSVWANLFLTALLKFDFRGDLDHLDVLRSLPLRPAAVAAAELVAPTAVLSAAQGLLLGAAATFGHLPVAWVAGAAVFVVPLNALVVGTENLLFLLFPFRQAAAVAGDMGMVGRQSVVFFCRMLVPLTAGGTAAVVGGVALLATGGKLVPVRGGVGYALAGGSVPLAGLVATAILVAAVALIVGLTGVVYGRFDPSVDTPA